MRENPRYNVVSMRVSDDEWEMLRQIKKETDRSISEIMRAAFAIYAAECDKHDMKRRAV